MNHQYIKAGVRAFIATMGILIWTVWFEGPGWAWAALAAYVMFTFGLAWALSRHEGARGDLDKLD